MSRFERRMLALTLCAAVLGLGACSRAPDSAAPPPDVQVRTESWEPFVARQIEAHLAAHPQWAVVQGRHEYDGQLPDWSRAGIEREIARLHRVPARIPGLAGGPRAFLDGKGRLPVSQP